MQILIHECCELGIEESCMFRAKISRYANLDKPLIINNIQYGKDNFVQGRKV